MTLGGSEDASVGFSRPCTGSEDGTDADPDAAAVDAGAGAAIGSEHPTSPNTAAIASAAMNFMVPPHSE
jgi:hypothetical protein